MLGQFKQIYIVVDAIDECKEGKDLVLFLKDMISWNIKGFHLLVSGQWGSDAGQRFDSIAKTKVYLETERVNVDIRHYIHSYL